METVLPSQVRRGAVPSALRLSAYTSALLVAMTWLVADAYLHARPVWPLNVGEVALLLALVLVGLLPSNAAARNRVRGLRRSSRAVGAVFIAVLVTTCVLPGILLLEALARFSAPTADGVLVASIVDSAAVFLLSLALVGEELFA